MEPAPLLFPPPQTALGAASPFSPPLFFACPRLKEEPLSFFFTASAPEFVKKRTSVFFPFGDTGGCRGGWRFFPPPPPYVATEPRKDPRLFMFSPSDRGIDKVLFFSSRTQPALQYHVFFFPVFFLFPRSRQIDGGKGVCYPSPLFPSFTIRVFSSFFLFSQLAHAE